MSWSSWWTASYAEQEPPFFPTGEATKEHSVGGLAGGEEGGVAHTLYSALEKIENTVEAIGHNIIAEREEPRDDLERERNHELESRLWAARQGVLTVRLRGTSLRGGGGEAGGAGERPVAVIASVYVRRSLEERQSALLNPIVEIARARVDVVGKAERVVESRRGDREGKGGCGRKGRARC